MQSLSLVGQLLHFLEQKNEAYTQAINLWEQEMDLRKELEDTIAQEKEKLEQLTQTLEKVKFLLEEQ